jgi:hypothetical protein
MRKYTFDRRQLKKKQRDIWCAALRSGDFVQVQHEMCEIDDPKSACCLHVASIAVDGNDWSSGVDHCGPQDLEVSAPFAIRAQLAKFKGLGGRERRAENLNDDDELTFNQIADLVDFGELEITQ